MSTRNHTNWLDAYVNYADNNFAPRAFHLWAGITLLASIVERKVWIALNHKKNLHLNIFTFFVAPPGAGKSSALDAAVDFLRDLNEIIDSPIRILPDQMTEQVLIDLMSVQKSVILSNTKTHFHSSALFPASEASNTFKNIAGSNELTSLLTQFYDAPNKWEKATKKDGTKTLTNVCLNIMAGCTFDYLGKLITGDSIFGGFASRIIYVVHKEKTVRHIKWRDGEGDDINAKLEQRSKLLQDAKQIASMFGVMKADKSFVEAYEEWYPRYEAERQAHPSEKMQSLLVRKSVNVLKVTALISLAVSGEMVMRREHFECAVALIDEVERALPEMLRESSASQNSAEGLMQALLGAFKGVPFVFRADLQSMLVLRGFDARKVASTIESLLNSSAMKVGIYAGRPVLQLMINPDAHL